jgi:hypothetical protein
MAALANATVECPGCHQPIELSLRLDETATPRHGELVLAVDRSLIEEHIGRAHPQDTDG